MSPYAIFMDIDGTLVGRSQVPSPATKAAIAKYRAAGHQFFIATGRALFSARAMADRIGPGLNVICANGSVTQVAGETSGIRLGATELAGIYQVAKRFGARATLFTETGVVSLEDTPIAVSRDAAHRMAGEDPRRNRTVHSVQELCALAPDITNGIIFHPDPSTLAQAKQALGAYPGLDLSSSNFDNIEITRHGINKASAIRQVCAQLAIPLRRTMAFGDGSNDLQMLTTVQYGVAMGNANAEVLAATHYKTLDINHDGVAHYLNAFFK
ncbi:Cof-type HAD-IIB family hydrolase [Lacticaseibacillus parakribbianus]|uniref:Cof-type HAD-IIB family hydrolase n=1 Tax=Lacticaseibacillus parakribbianus TaxID=2970927 RepID=UPI0021CB3D83|nr:HAD family hydrolase [Lacticaseibacillus parakribbianus]